MTNQYDKLKLIYEYDTSFFSYSQITKRMWDDLLLKAKKEFNIYFDLENNDTKRKQRTIIIPQNFWENTDCKFKCELFAAGGDWEYPVLYFRCQIEGGYAFGVTKYGNSHFIFIPGKTEGNYHLVPNGKNGWNAPVDGEYKKGIDPEANERQCWSSLKDYLTKLVNTEIENIKNKRENNDSV